jgi:glycogen operon protein
VAADALGSTLGGAAEPLGFRRVQSGGRFTVHARAAKSLAVELFDPGAPKPFAKAKLERAPCAPPLELWRADFAALPERFEYGYRANGGPLLLDPYAPLASGGEIWGRSDDALAPGVGRRYRGLVVPDAFDWQGVARPRIDPQRRSIVELHLRGFTRHPTSGVSRPGTYLGAIEKIPYLVELGVTTVELLPLCEFDETENPRANPATGERLFNFWGYSPVSFFAPKAAYAASSERGAAAVELKTLVRELHRAGLEVVLDVVYNHTAEGELSARDALHSFRGLAPLDYYLFDPASGRRLDFTGCGHTVNANHPVVRRLVLDSLRHWTESYRIDGFRFDLAAVFFRNERGEPLARSPLAEEIAADPVLADRLLVAEPWDATGFRPEAGFPAPWLEWDGEFRDAVRRFAGGLEREPAPLARRLAGLGPRAGALPVARAVRFAACHDGRPLADVVRYARKANRANGEENRDGWDGEVAWNGGVEGPTDDPALVRRRERELRLLWTLLAAAPGTLFFAAGDERGRTQRGNTNAWCQDNEISWLDWSEDAERRALGAFVRRLLRERVEGRFGGADARGALVLPFESFPAAEPEAGAAFLVVRSNVDREASALVAANSSPVPVRVPIPMLPTGRRWRIRLDLARPKGAEVFEGDEAPFLAYETTELLIAARSARVLVAEEFELPRRRERAKRA